MKLRNMRDSYNAAHIQSELIDCCINEVAQLECLINKQSLTIRDGKKTIMVRILGIGDGDMFIIETSLDRALATSSIIDDNILALQERLQKVADVVPCAEKDKKSVGVVEA